jgi:hypothetical protein
VRRTVFTAMSAAARIRAYSLIAFGALLVHNLRYAVDFHGDWREALAEQGHAHLTLIAPLVAVLLLTGGCLFVVELRRARRTSAPVHRLPSERPFWMSWLATSAALSAIYVGQELTEGMLSNEHSHGVAGALGGHGWTAFVIALAVGGFITIVLRCADRAIEARCRGRVVWNVLDLSVVAGPLPDQRPLDAVARHRAARGPPISA